MCVVTLYTIHIPFQNFRFVGKELLKIVISCRFWTMQKLMRLDIHRKKCQKHKILGMWRTIDWSLDKINPSLRWVLLRKNNAYTEHCSRRSKVKVTPEHAMRAQRGSRSAALPIQKLRARGGSEPHPGHFTPRIRLIAQETGWPSGSVWTGVENPFFTGFQTPDHPVRSESLYRLRHSGRLLWRLCVGSLKIKWTLCTTRSHVGEVEIKLRAFLSLTLVPGKGRLKDLDCLTPGNEHPVANWTRKCLDSIVGLETLETRKKLHLYRI